MKESFDDLSLTQDVAGDNVIDEIGDGSRDEIIKNFQGNGSMTPGCRYCGGTGCAVCQPDWY